MNPRFLKLQQAFYRLLGRADMSLKLHAQRRAHLQTLAAARILKWMTQ